MAEETKAIEDEKMPMTASQMGKKGGLANGESKRRSKAFYMRISKLGVKAREKNNVTQVAE